MARGAIGERQAGRALERPGRDRGRGVVVRDQLEGGGVVALRRGVEALGGARIEELAVARARRLA